MVTFIRVLHEFMHYPLVTTNPPGRRVADFVYSAWSCYNPTKGSKLLNQANLSHNADSWTWYALYIYLTKVSGRVFSNSRGPQDN